MSVIASIIEVAPAFIPAAGAWVAWKWVNSAPKYLREDPFAEPVVDGRTETEWYELIRDNGKEYTEELMLGPLASKTTDAGEIELFRDDSHAWNPAKLMGNYYWQKLQNEWYPFRNYPAETYDRSRQVTFFYSKPDDNDVMVIKAVKGKHKFETEILAEADTFKGLKALAEDALWDKIRAEEKKEHAELIKKKEEAKRLRDEEWLKERVRKQREKVVKPRNKTPIDDLEALMRKNSKMLKDLERDTYIINGNKPYYRHGHDDWKLDW